MKLIGARGPESALFPSLHGSGSFAKGSATISTDWLRLRIKAAVAAIGLNPAEYSGHSLRAGGATDLFVARVPLYVIKKKGRWASDAVMVYYRDEEDVDMAVEGGFKQRLDAMKNGG